MTPGKPITIGETTVAPGTRAIIDLPVATLYTHARLKMPVQVLNGRQAGPTLFVSAAVHGDEINASRSSAACWPASCSAVCTAPCSPCRS